MVSTQEQSLSRNLWLELKQNHFLMNTKNLKNKSKKKFCNAIWSLREEAKGGFTSFTDIIEMKTVLDLLREKHLEQRKANLNYLVSNEHSKFYHTINPHLRNSMPKSLESLPWRRMGVLALPVLIPTNGEHFWLLLGHLRLIYAKQMIN